MSKVYIKGIGSKTKLIDRAELESLIKDGIISPEAHFWDDEAKVWKPINEYNKVKEKLQDTESLINSLVKPKPWTRFAAKFFDLGLCRLGLEIIGSLILLNEQIETLYRTHYFISGVITFLSHLLLFVIYESFFISKYKATIGKMLVSTQVVNNSNYGTLSFKKSLQRSLHCLGTGMWFLIWSPLIVLIPGYDAYKTLKRCNITKWDYKADALVLHKKSNPVLLVVVSLIALLFIAISDVYRRVVRKDFLNRHASELIKKH